MQKRERVEEGVTAASTVLVPGVVDGTDRTYTATDDDLSVPISATSYRSRRIYGTLKATRLNVDSGSDESFTLFEYGSEVEVGFENRKCFHTVQLSVDLTPIAVEACH